VKVARCCWLVALAGACRLGGPSGDPAARVEFPGDAAAASDASSSPADSGGDDALVPGAPADAAPGSEASPEASFDAATGADATDADAACTPPSPAVCNPVTNTGCTLSQCDIDTSHMTPTGTCVISSPFPNDAGSPCTQVSGSVSCQPGFTCFGGTCQKVCFCNSDCAASTCCSGTAGTTGFGLCGACR
jgi:hypothetical protein